MINENDILDMTCLTREQIAAIAAHEHIGTVQAASLGEYLMHLHHGPQQVQRMICEDIAQALHADDPARARALYAALKLFLAEHPEALRGNG
jgi:ABC-type Zn2+ transport system substrate-binding protein/surface adhesin